MANLAEVILRLRAAQAEIDDAIRSLACAQDRTDRAQAVIAHALGGSKPVVGYLGQVSYGMTQVRGGMAAARGKIDETIAKVRELDRGSAGRSQSPPSGEEVVQRSKERGRKLDRFLRQTTENGDDVVDGSREVTSLIERGASAGRGGAGQGGAPYTSGTVAQPSPQPPPSAPDVVAGLVASSVLVVEGVRAAWRYLRRGKENRSRDTDA